MASMVEESIIHIQHKICGVSINTRMIPSKLSYFMSAAAIGCYLFFQNIFLVSVGLTPSEAGFISAMCYVATFIVGPVCGALTDYTGYRKLIFVTLCLFTGLTAFSLPWVARSVGPANLIHFPINPTIMANASTPHKPRNRCLTNSSASLNDTKVNFTFSDGKDCNHKLIPFSGSLFYWMLALSMISFSFALPIVSFLDSVVMNIIKKSQTKDTYGKQRMFSALGIGVGNVISAMAVDYFNHPNMSKYSPALFIYLPLNLLLIPLALVLFKQTNWENEEDEEVILFAANDVQEEKSKTSRIQLLVAIFRKWDYIIIMFSVLMAGLLRCVTFSFLYLIMRDEMHASAAPMGVALLVNCLADFFMFPFTKKVMKMVGGPIICIEIGLLAWVIRLVVISYIKNPWLVIFPQTLQCVSFALLWSAIVEYTQQISSKEISMVMFQFVYCVHYSAAGIIGNMAGGVMYNSYKGPVLYRSTAVLGGVWIIVIFIYFHMISFVKKTSRSREETLMDTSI